MSKFTNQRGEVLHENAVLQHNPHDLSVVFTEENLQGTWPKAVCTESTNSDTYRFEDSPNLYKLDSVQFGGQDKGEKITIRFTYTPKYRHTLEYKFSDRPSIIACQDDDGKPVYLSKEDEMAVTNISTDLGTLMSVTYIGEGRPLKQAPI